MFVLNPGRYVVGDPALILDEATFKRLCAAGTRFNALTLKTGNGPIIAPATGGNGDFVTDLGRSLRTDSGHMAFVPYGLAGRLLTSDVIRISLQRPALLYFSSRSNIVLDGKLTIYCSQYQSSSM